MVYPDRDAQRKRGSLEKGYLVGDAKLAKYALVGTAIIEALVAVAMLFLALDPPWTTFRMAFCLVFMALFGGAAVLAFLGAREFSKGYVRGRTYGTAAAVLLLPFFPLGTFLGVCVLVSLGSKDAQVYLGAHMRMRDEQSRPGQGPAN